MCVTINNNYDSNEFKAFGVNTTPEKSTAFLKNNPFVRSLKPAKAAFNTKTVMLKSGVETIKEIEQEKAAKKQKHVCVDYREAAIIRNAQSVEGMMFRRRF